VRKKKNEEGGAVVVSCDILISTYVSVFSYRSDCSVKRELICKIYWHIYRKSAALLDWKQSHYEK
jgi:hypothetical protein